MDENIFWAMIETAWQAAGGKAEARRMLAEGRLSDDEAEVVRVSLEEVIPALRKQLDGLSAEELLAFDRILERKLYDIDRAEISGMHGRLRRWISLCARIYRRRRAGLLRRGTRPALGCVDGPGVRGDVLSVVAHLQREVRDGAALRHLTGILLQRRGLARSRIARSIHEHRRVGAGLVPAQLHARNLG